MGLIVHLFIESRCNYRCKHCFTSKKNERLTVKDVKYFLDMMSSYNIDSVNIAGSGNPLLNSEFDRIISYCSNYGDVTLNFRGIIDDSKILLLKDYNVKVYYSIDRIYNTVEFYGNNLGEIQWDYLVKLIESDVEIIIRTTVMRDNIKDVKDIISTAHTMAQNGWIEGWYGMPYVAHKPDDPLLPSDEQLLTIYRTISSITDGVFLLVHPVTNALDPRLHRKFKEMVEPYGWTCGFGKKDGRVCLKEDKMVYGCAFDIEPLTDMKDIECLWCKAEEKAMSAPLPDKCRNCSMYRKGKCKGGCIVTRTYANDVVCPVVARE